jgi:hypothetical protein
MARLVGLIAALLWLLSGQANAQSIVYTFTGSSGGGSCGPLVTKTYTGASASAVWTPYLADWNAGGAACTQPTSSTGATYSETSTTFTMVLSWHNTAGASGSLTYSGTKSAGTDTPIQNGCPTAGVSAGQVEKSGQSTAGSGAATLACQPMTTGTAATGCVVSVGYDMAVGYGTPISYTWIGTGRYTGATCNAGDYPPLNPLQSTPTGTTTATLTDCPKGQVRGTINGQGICYTPSPDSTVTKSTAAGTVTTSTPTGTTTTGTQSTTTCTGTTCTTTTTTTTSAPSEGGTCCTTSTQSKTETQDKPSFCTEHPKDTQCVSSGSFSGSCTAGFTCEGDAVMCSIARASNEEKCGLLEKTSPESELYATTKGATSMPFTSSTTSISQSSFDTTNALGVAGTCIPNTTVVVFGKTVVLPISDVCPSLGHMGTLLLAVSWLAAFAIVGKGVS